MAEQTIKLRISQDPVRMQLQPARVIRGLDGVSPEILVTEIDGGHCLVISDAFGIKYVDIMDGPPGPAGSDATVTVDSALSDTSTNPVQNKVVKAAIDALSAGTGSTSQAYFLTTYTADENGVVTADHTFAEQKAAFVAGNILIAKYGERYLQATNVVLGAVLTARIEYSNISITDSTVNTLTITHKHLNNRMSVTEESNDFATQADIAAVSTANQALFLVNYTADDEGNITADHTYVEIIEAIVNSQVVNAYFEGMLFQIAAFNEEGVTFLLTVFDSEGILSYMLVHAPDDTVFAEPLYAPIATSTSQLENDSGYQTADQVTALINNAMGVIENGAY